LWLWRTAKKGIEELTGRVKCDGIEVLIIGPWRLWLGKDENNAMLQ